MQELTMSDPINPKTITRTSSARRITGVAVALLVVWAIVAYIVVPAVWKRFVHTHPSLDVVPRITQTADGIPGDPLNVALIGTKADLIKIMLAAKWYPADPLSLKSSLEIAVDAVFKRPDPNAPVSNLYLFGRKEDLAFEQEVGHDPRHRHHVRFWQTGKIDPDGRPVWIGSAVYDERVGLSRTTGQITHVAAPDVDTERDYLFACLKQTGDLAEISVIEDFHKVRSGKNGGGDPWTTDGNLDLGVIALKIR
jgi:LssY C-terminus